MFKVLPLAALFIVQLTSAAYGQGRLGSFAEDKLKQSVESGSLVFTSSANSAPKKKSVQSISSVNGSDPLFMTVYLNKKFSAHQVFKHGGSVTVIFETKDGKTHGHEFKIKPEDMSKNFACVELFPKTLSADDYNMVRTCNFFKSLGNGQHDLKMYMAGEKSIDGNLRLDFSKGTGRFGEIADLIEKKKQEEAAEEQRKKEEKEKQRQQAVKEFQSSPDAVKVAFKNTCEWPGSISVSTDNELTSFRSTVNKGTQSEFMICRPGNKIYLGNELIHTVSAKSNNQVINICPKRPETAPECMGSRRISIVYIENRTGKQISYSIAGDGFSGGGSIYNGDTDKIRCCPYNATLQINNSDYIEIKQNHEGQTIIVR